MTDLELLQEYRRSNSQEAFTELARRHADWVYSAALRLVRDHHLAEEVVQATFLILARKAGMVRREPLSPWLFRVVRNCSSQALRSRRRRTRHEKEVAMIRESTQPEPQIDWSEIAPLLDESVACLKAVDRKAILMRYYQRMSVADVASVLGISQAAARRRLSRAVEKLRHHLGAKGIVIPAVGLAALLTTETTRAAPAGLFTGAASTETLKIVKGAILTMFNTKMKVAALFVLLALLIPAGIGAYLWADDGTSPGAHAPPSTDNPVAVAPMQNAVVGIKPGADLTSDELSKIMGVKSWKLDVSVPPGTTEMRGRLEVRRKSGKPEMLTGFSYPVKGDNPHRLVVAMVREGKKYRVMMMMGLTGSTSGTIDDLLRSVAGEAERTSDTIDDPFRPAAADGTTTELKDPQLLSDSSFGLMGYFSQAHPIMLDRTGGLQTSPPAAVDYGDLNGADVSLVLVLKPSIGPAPTK